MKTRFFSKESIRHALSIWTQKDLVGLLLVLAILLALGFPLSAAPDTSATDNLKDLPQFLEKEMKRWKVPGMAVAVVKDGKVIFSSGFGYVDLVQTRKVTPRTLFSVASGTKAFTATLAGLLVDEGKIQWDVPVVQYVPEFKLKDPVASAGTTFIDIFTHRTGLSRQEFLRWNMPNTRAELMQRLRFIEPGHPFRHRWEYSNLMFTTAGHILERVTGKTWEENLNTRLLEPLGMKHSVFSVTAMQKAPDFAYPYIERLDGVKPLDFQNNDVLGPAGALCSNVEDLSRWVIFNLNGGKVNGKSIISPRTLMQIHAPRQVVPSHPRFKELHYDNYAMGWFVSNYRGCLHIHHGGVLYGFSSLISFMPREGIGVVILANLNATPLTTITERHIYDRLLQKEPVDWSDRLHQQYTQMKAYYKKVTETPDTNKKSGTQPTHRVDVYAGVYENDAYGTITIQNQAQRLTALLNAYTLPLEHYHYDIFEMVNKIQEDRRKVYFSTGDNGEIDGFNVELYSPGVPQPHRAFFKKLTPKKETNNTNKTD